MNHPDYYEELHMRIGGDLKISPKVVEMIRSYALGPLKLTRGQIIIRLKKKIDSSGKVLETINEKKHDCPDCTHIVKRKHITAGTPSTKIKLYQEVLRFIHDATESDWKDVIYQYPKP